ncbi:cytochrome P450, partial [Mycena vulgaris]
LVGNLFQLSENLWIPFTKWKKEHGTFGGSIVYLNIIGRPVIVLNSLKAASDLLDGRPAIYSDRPQNIVASQILTGSLFMPFIGPGLLLFLPPPPSISPYNSVHSWRKMHQATHDCLAKTSSHNFFPYQAKEAILLVEGLLNDAPGWDHQLRRSTSSMIMSFLYDIPGLSDAQDPSISRINSFVERIVRAAKPGAHLVELFTWMQYFPLWAAPWKRHGLKSYQADSEMFRSLFTTAKQRALDGKANTSFANFLLLSGEKYALDQEQSSWLLATMYAAGAETTSSVLSWFFLAMILYPDVQSRAQAEIDEIVGRSRMPVFSDLEHLPYLGAVVTEVLRWVPVDPIGESFFSQDDWYEGYFIPKGSICIANIWGIHRDRALYGDDAEVFNPARHLDSTGKLASAVPRTKGESHVTFGFGTRVCPGRHVAKNTISINIASVLWGLEIRPATDKEGLPLIPNPDDMVITGLTIHPAPFSIDIKSRFEEMLNILTNTKELHGL